MIETASEQMSGANEVFERMETSEETPNKRQRTNNDVTNDGAGKDAQDVRVDTPSTAESKMSYDDDHGESTVETCNGSENQERRSRTKRRFPSVFSSNQAFHQLTDQIVETYQQNEERGGQEEDSEQSQTSGNDTSGGLGSGQDQSNGSNASVHPSPSSQRTNHSGQEDQAQDDDEDCEIEITDSNVTNPFIDYPHQRNLCGVFPFLPLSENGNDVTRNVLFCKNCYCKVCDKPATECQEWANHCHACDTPEWQLKKLDRKRQAAAASGDVICLDGTSDEESSRERPDGDGNTALQNLQATFDRGLRHALQHADLLNKDGDDDDDLMGAYDHHFTEPDLDQDLIGQKSRKDARIVEVLAHNLRQLSNLSIANNSVAKRTIEESFKQQNGDTNQNTRPPLTAEQMDKMEGDVTPLNLHKSFFVEGVRIGWPYPMIMPPQRQMAIHLIKAFKNQRHVVIESPTGTG